MVRRTQHVVDSPTSPASSASPTRRRGKKHIPWHCQGGGRRCRCDHIAVYEIVKSDCIELPTQESIPACVLDLGDTEAVSVWRHEQLLAALQWHLTWFWKKVVPQELAWSPTSNAKFRGYVAQILYFKKTSSRMGGFVQKWISESALYERKKHVSQNKSVQEQEHRLEFWAKYRNQTEKTDLPMHKHPKTENQAGEIGRSCIAKVLTMDNAPLETHGAFWRPAISTQTVKNPAAQIHRRRTSALLDSKDKQSQMKSKQNMSWTNRAAADTRGHSDRRWVLGQQFCPPEVCTDGSNGGVVRHCQNQIEDRHFIRLVPGGNGPEGAELVFRKMDKLKRRQSQCSERWESQIASAIQPKAEREMSGELPNSWAITGVPPDSSKSTYSIDKQTAAQDTRQAQGKPEVKQTMGSKSVSLPNLTQRAPFSSMYRQKAVHMTSITDSPLPALANVVKEDSLSNASQSNLIPSSTKRYVKVCHKYGIIPTPMPFLIGLSANLDASDRALTDSDLLAVAAMIRSMDSIEEVDLEGNTLLTDKALVAFLRKLFGPPASRTLRRLSLKGCSQAGRLPAEIVIELVNSSNGLNALNQLDLSGIQIAMNYHLSLAAAICEHPRLSVVSLVDTGLGKNPIAKQVLAKLLTSITVHTLDLGWNTFNTDVFSQVGASVVDNQFLRSLSVANCAATSSAITKPVMFFLEYLSRDKRLEFLDISMNRLDFHEALILEDALETHKNLQTVCISQNPLGALGLRSILRLLARETSGLTRLICDSCFALSEPLAGADIFRVSFPIGSYALALDRPYHRSMLRMLYKICDRLGVSAAETFTNMETSVSRFNHPEHKDVDGIWPVPYGGNLSFYFAPLKAMDLVPRSQNALKLDPHLDAFAEMLKLKPSMRKMAPLLALWQAIEGRMQEQSSMLEAVSRDFLFTYPQIEQICRSRLFACKAIANLFHCVSNGHVGRYLCLQLLPTLGERMAVRKLVDKFMALNVDNPTGHYVLDLSVPVDLGIAERLVLLDTWEQRLSQHREDDVDTSQRGNSSHFRNEEYQKQVLSNLGLSTMAEWCLPGVGILEFDYVSSRRPPRNAAVLRSDTFQKLQRALRFTNCEAAEKAKTLRKVSAEMWITSMQLRQLIMGMRSREVVDDIIVLFFFRVQDIWNEKLFRVRCQDLGSLYHRLGYFNFFPFFQMEHEEFVFDFSVYEQRLIGNHLVHMSVKENGAAIKNPNYEHADGTKDTFPMGIPRGWETERGMPTSGVFSATYVCAPECSNFAERRRLCKRFSRWGIGIHSYLDPSFTHWGSLSNAPPDVIKYLKALKAKYVNTQAAFRAIDGVGGNGVISLREFEDNIQELGCPVLAGSSNKQRVVDLYRYLDANETGNLSKQEWCVLDHLWNEVSLSIKEFHDCICEHFRGDLMAAWEEMDEDHSGGLDEQEWRAASEKFGYLGPAKDIFHFLDQDARGVITLEKFLSLRHASKSALPRTTT